MQSKYCLPIIKSDPSEIQTIISDNIDKYQYFEVWLDYIDNLDDNFTHDLIHQLNGRLVLLFRRQNLDPIHLPLEKRLAIIQSLESTLTLVDLDISQTQELDYLRQNKLEVKLITSYHNYHSTPNTVHLEKIIVTMEEYDPAVYKLATHCEREEDGLALLQQLLKLKARGKNAIVLGMGEFGAITRVFGALWGNEMTFAPATADEKSAPGQLTRQQLESIFKELG